MPSLLGSHPTDLAWYGDMWFSVVLVAAILVLITLSFYHHDRPHLLHAANAISFLLLSMIISVSLRIVAHSIEKAGKRK